MSEWTIQRGETISDHLSWAQDDGTLVDVSGMSLEVRLSSALDYAELERHTVTAQTVTLDGEAYNISLDFTPALAAGTYRAELHVGNNGEQIVFDLPNLKIGQIIEPVTP